MRVTFIFPSHAHGPGGGARIACQYANYLVEHGHEVNLIFPRSIGLKRSSLRLRTKLAKDWWIARTSAATRRLAGSSALPWIPIDHRINLLFVTGLDSHLIPDADAVFATYWRTAEYLGEYPASKGEKFYLIQHYEIWAGPKERVDRTWLAPFHKVVISRWLYDIGRSLGATQMRYITNAIDHQQFRITPSNKARDLALVTMFSSQSWKGVDDAVSVMARLHERYPDLRLSMFGLDPRPSQLPRWIQYFRNPKSDDLRRLYNAHSIYLGASKEEGWGLPPAEAMACGCAFVGTDIGGFREYAINGRTALLSPPGDRNAMFENLCRVIEDRELRDHLQRAGTECVRKFTWEKSGALLERYLRDVVELDRCESAVASKSLG
jgi:glycosyltransferase involved in cell wall biosynthesis